MIMIIINNPYKQLTLLRSVMDISLKDLTKGIPCSVLTWFCTCIWNIPGWFSMYLLPKGTNSCVSQADIISSISRVLVLIIPWKNTQKSYTYSYLKQDANEPCSVIPMFIYIFLYFSLYMYSYGVFCTLKWLNHFQETTEWSNLSLNTLYRDVWNSDIPIIQWIVIHVS